jgi:hypothetical protein
VTFETTDADLRRWQARDARALVAMLEAAHGAGLPTLHWSIGSIGGLLGEAHGLGSSVAEQRAAFDAWADFLGAARWPERTDSAGITRLHAQFVWRNDDRVKGMVRADLIPEDDIEPF